MNNNTLLFFEASILSGCEPGNNKNSALLKVAKSDKASDSAIINKIKDKSSDSDKFTLRFLDKGFESNNLDIIINQPLNFKVDHNLNYYLPITLTNQSAATVVGVSFAKYTEDGLGYLDLGKFKVNIKAKSKTHMKISLKDLRINDEKATEGLFMQKIAITSVFYSDGTYSTEKVTFE